MRNKIQKILFFLCCLPFMVQADETVTYLHHDVLGSVIGTSDNAGKLQKTEYLSYGTKKGVTSTESSELGYTGKPHFKELGLSYYGSRWYDPDAGRFTGIDPVAWTKQYAVHSFNRYSYANNNPYKYVDPDVRIVWFAVFAFVGKEAAAEGLSYLTGGATDFLSTRRLGLKVAKEVAANFTEKSLTTAVRSGIKDLPRSVTKNADIKVIGRLEDTKVAQDWDGHDVLNIPDWTIKKNDQWVEQGIKNKQDFYTASPPTKSNKWDKAANRETAYGRELNQVEDVGYVKKG